MKNVHKEGSLQPNPDQIYDTLDDFIKDNKLKLEKPRYTPTIR